VKHQIICGDCLNVLPTLADVDMIFADPPDNIGLKYDNGQSDKLPKKQYKNYLKEVIVISSRHAPVVWLSANAKWEYFLAWHLYSYGWSYRKIVWTFTFGQQGKRDLSNCYRPIFRIAPADFEWNTDAIRVPSDRQLKYNDKRANPDGKVPSDVWEFPRVCGTFKERRKWHPTQHPEALVERAILMSTKEGDLVVDPFLGSGTTLRVCQRINRRCIGIELSETYCKKVSEETGVEVTT